MVAIEGGVVATSRGGAGFLLTPPLEPPFFAPFIFNLTLRAERSEMEGRRPKVGVAANGQMIMTDR